MAKRSRLLVGCPLADGQCGRWTQAMLRHSRLTTEFDWIPPVRFRRSEGQSDTTKPLVNKVETMNISSFPTIARFRTTGTTLPCTGRTALPHSLSKAPVCQLL